MSIFLVRNTQSETDCSATQQKESKVIDFDNLLEYAKPFDSLQVSLEPTEDINPPSRFMRGVTRVPAFKLLDLTEFHRPFSSEQIYTVLGNVKGLGRRTQEKLGYEVDLSKLGSLVRDGNWEQVERLLMSANLGLELAGRILEALKKLAKELRHFAYLVVTNFLKRYQKCHLDDAKWKKCRTMIAKLMARGITGPQVVASLTENPYRYLIEGQVSANLTRFQILDAIGRYGPYSEKWSLEDESRQGAGLLATLMERIYETGDCFVLEEVLRREGQRTLGTLDPKHLAKVPQATRYQLGEKRIVFPERLDSCERSIVTFFANYRFQRPYTITRESILEVDPDLDEEQVEVIYQVLRSGVGVITGPPGVGKTRVISAIHNWLLAQGEQLVLSAPTGLACKNIAKTVETPVMTVAKLLYRGAQKKDGSEDDSSDDEDLSDAGDPAPTIGATVTAQGAQIQVRGTGPTLPEYDCLLEDLVNQTGGMIVDEVSMLDVSDFFNMIEELPPENYRLILVGDPNQLPSIGPGKVLKDVINGGLLPVYRLSTNYRQKRDPSNASQHTNGPPSNASHQSKILENAMKILEGNVKLESGSDFKIGRTNSDEQTLEIALQLLDRINAHELLDDLIILSPYSNKQFLATRNINKSFKTYFNKNAEVSWGPFSVGDRVMQMKNDYAHGIVNGDIGNIKEIKFRRGNEKQLDSLVVEYPSGTDDLKQVKYSSHSAREQLTLAYAVSIHKSQGNGYRHVLVLIPQYYNPQFFNRNMLYTAVTRARECVYLLGGNFDRAIETAHRDRNTRLSFRMKCRKVGPG